MAEHLEPEELHHIINNPTDQSNHYLLLDVRPYTFYNTSSIRTALNLNIPSYLMKRFHLSTRISHLFQHQSQRDYFSSKFNDPDLKIIIYDTGLKREEEKNKVTSSSKKIMYDSDDEGNDEGDDETENELDFSHNQVDQNKLLEIAKFDVNSATASWLEFFSTNGKLVRQLKGGFNDYFKSYPEDCSAIRPTELNTTKPLQFEVNKKMPTMILDNFLYLGSYMNSNSFEDLSTLGIRYVLNVANDVSNSYPLFFHYLRCPIVDSETQEIDAYFARCFAFIEKARTNKSSILIHCMMGISRSASITIAYLMKYNHLTLKKAFLLVKEKRPAISPNAGFMRQLYDFEEKLYGKNSFNSLDDMFDELDIFV